MQDPTITTRIKDCGQYDFDAVDLQIAARTLCSLIPTVEHLMEHMQNWLGLWFGEEADGVEYDDLFAHALMALAWYSRCQREKEE